MMGNTDAIDKIPNVSCAQKITTNRTAFRFYYGQLVITKRSGSARKRRHDPYLHIDGLAYSEADGKDDGDSDFAGGCAGAAGCVRRTPSLAVSNTR